MYTGEPTDWVQLPDRGKVHAFTVCHFGSEAFLPETPFVLVLVEFEEADTLFFRGSLESILSRPLLIGSACRSRLAICAIASSSRPTSISYRRSRGEFAEVAVPDCSGSAADRRSGYNNAIFSASGTDSVGIIEWRQSANRRESHDGSTFAS